MDDSLASVIAALRGRRVVALAGAGMSTESGIPDYRGDPARARARRPIQGPEFRRSSAVRQRYWARAAIGWERFHEASPNDGHRALARWERAGSLVGVITQNVDRLHHRAGSTRVVELHGALAEVECLACHAVEPRAAVQSRLLADNPHLSLLDARVAPDGDADLDGDAIARTVVPACVRCEGVLQPRVVFFGDNVPRARVDAAFSLLDEADALLVAGTSLAVFSGYRFLLRAKERGLAIAIVNVGPVRGEEHAQARAALKTGEALPALVDSLLRAPA